MGHLKRFISTYFFWESFHALDGFFVLNFSWDDLEDSFQGDDAQKLRNFESFWRFSEKFHIIMVFSLEIEAFLCNLQKYFEQFDDFQRNLAQFIELLKISTLIMKILIKNSIFHKFLLNFNKIYKIYQNFIKNLIFWSFSIFFLQFQHFQTKIPSQKVIICHKLSISSLIFIV